MLLTHCRISARMLIVRKTLIGIFCVSGLALAASVNTLQSFKQQIVSEDSELVKTIQGLDVYTYANQEQESFYWARTRVPFPISDCEAILDNIEKYIEWVPNMIEVHSVNIEPETVGTFYNAMDAPWPLRDRECLLAFEKMGVQDRAIGYTFKSFVDENFNYHPKREQVDMKGEWSLICIDGKETDVVYKISLEICDGVPASLARRYIQKLPVKNIRNFEQFLVQEFGN